MKIPRVVRFGLLLATTGAAAEPPAFWSKPADTPNDSLVSPEVSAEGRVTFRIYAPEAKSVSLRLNSDFGKGPPDFVKDDKGVWSTTTSEFREARGGERPENVRPPWHQIPIGRNSWRPCLVELAALFQPFRAATISLKNPFGCLTQFNLSEVLHSPSSPEAS
ncbi:MAG: hypothetical protein V4584_12795 [Verrucomicrobiota bacterium]